MTFPKELHFKWREDTPVLSYMQSHLELPPSKIPLLNMQIIWIIFFI
jgi:hypothetical protein